MSDLDDIMGVEENHPSYALLEFYRVSSSVPTPLFGSSIKHRGTIVLRLKKASCRRNLNEDRYYGDGLLYEVEMSYSQFAELISSMNTSDGIPVTLKFEKSVGRIEPCPYKDNKELFRQEFEDTLSNANEYTRGILHKLITRFKDPKPIGKKEREELIKDMQMLYNKVQSNTSFVFSQFLEQMDNTVKEAKREIEAFTENKVGSKHNSL